MRSPGNPVGESENARRDRNLLILWLVVITAYRVYVARTHGLNLYVDEAQYWYWAQSLDWGYFSKPPMVAVAIWLPTQFCGDAEPCVRAAPLLLYPITTLVLYAIAYRYYGSRTALLAGVFFSTMPGVSLSSLIISTDVLLFLFWALAVLGLQRAIETDRWRDWLLVGIASGLGLETKYTMGVFGVCAVLYFALDPSQRRQLWNPRIYVAAGVAGLIFLPNVLWNIAHDFPTIRHTAHIANLDSGSLNWDELGEFLGGQFAVFGPVLFALFLVVLGSGRRWASDRRSLFLICSSLPFLVIISLQALLGRANANWAAPTYVAATVLVARYVTDQVRRPKARALVAAAAISCNVAAAVALYHFDTWATLFGVELSRSTDPLKRYRGWDRFGQEIAGILASHPGARLMAEERELLSELAYYVKPHPLDLVSWNPSGALRSHYDLVASLDSAAGDHFVYVTERDDIDDVRRAFGGVELLREVEVRVHDDWRLSAQVFFLTDFRGYDGSG